MIFHCYCCCYCAPPVLQLYSWWWQPLSPTKCCSFWTAWTLSTLLLSIRTPSKYSLDLPHLSSWSKKYNQTQRRAQNSLLLLDSCQTQPHWQWNDNDSSPIIHSCFKTYYLRKCNQLIAVAERSDYWTDQPLTGQPGMSIIAQACTWVVDHKMNNLDRAKEFHL